MKLLHMLAGLVAATLTFSAAAQNLKPGLWEVTNKVQGGSAEMEKARAEAQQQMASMSPAERKMMEDMMAKRGMKMGAGGPGAMSAKMCLTKEMIERNEVGAQQGDCKTTKQQRSGSTIKMVFSCANPPSSGEGQFTIVSPEAYTMKMAITSAARGKPETMNMDGAGKWVGADCGNIKPARPPNTK